MTKLSAELAYTGVLGCSSAMRTNSVALLMLLAALVIATAAMAVASTTITAAQALRCAL
jgi:hypothetical protein